MAHRFLSTAAALVASTLALTGCSAGASSDEKTTVTFRLWDSTVAAAYEDSLDAFEKENPTIDVKIKVVDWADYWTKLRTDVAEKKMDDIFWVNNSYFGAYADSGNLVNIDKALDSDASEAWETSVVEQFTRDDTLWGVPQLYDAGVAVYYNKALVEAAGVTPDALGDLTWSPDPAADTYLAVAKSLTLDTAGVSAADPAFNGTIAQYGTNLANDTQSITLPFIGSNGGVYQKGDAFAFSDPKTVEAITYLVNAINTAKVAPAAADTNTNSDFSRDAFIDGKLALFQSGLFNLKNIDDGADFEWGVAPMPEGPAGRVSVTNGIVVAGNAASEKQDAIAEVLTWLGSEKGNGYLGTAGAAVPAVKSAQARYFDYWDGKDVSVDPFFDVIEQSSPISAPTGANYGKGFEAFEPIFQQIFTGTLDPQVGLKQAEDAANAAIGG
ncbi:multiple sugar transport system substrate-binding protein [Okibacterium sp. HSC-33S16]|uniref:ABC transporter substrate-binding protein n=1 Tax=Okibacterium sp. HSC-33S16 TaxID=2910965 RepID=UPI00209DAF59|nr:sugar ABC transporter substrate-binding protein [Okibacterium sp. HSC-33S16]MCP2031254.1 multiple sugar transport system substrate-binding protein [Okibacterium sp. HSC-33S16]